jgi:hypothetical protein
MQYDARCRAAYEMIEPEIADVLDAELMAINIDVPSVVATVLGALPSLRAMEASGLSPLRSQALSRLENYAYALGHAHALYTAAPVPAEIVALQKRARKIRRSLCKKLRALITQGYLPASCMQGVVNTNAALAPAGDLISMVAVLRDYACVIPNKLLVSESELSATVQLAEKLLHAIQHRVRSAHQKEHVTMMRRRVFTLLVRAYTELRKSVRRKHGAHGDAVVELPSLYRGRVPHRNRRA